MNVTVCFKYRIFIINIFIAFAELQTDMTDLTADLENSGIPTLDHTSYIMKVFFPGVSDHPILNSPKVRYLPAFCTTETNLVYVLT